VSEHVEQYRTSFNEQVAAMLPAAARRVEGLGDRLRAAGVEPEELVDVASLDRVPVLRKDELVELQAAAPPFAGLVAAEPRPRRIFQSPGPLYEAEPRVPDPWRWAPALRAAGFGDEDVVLNSFGYHLTPAGAMFEQACFALGATVVPGGVGNMDLQALACRDLGVTAYIGLPSYLNALLEKAEGLQLEPGSWALRRAFVAAEPLPASLRSSLDQRIPVLRQGYGTAETGNLGYECDARRGLHLPADALVQVCDLTTGKALWDGREGEVVVTLLSEHTSLVRFGTGDLSALLLEGCDCGLATPRIAGWLGRVGEAVKVRGMFLHPRQARATLADVPEVERFRFVVERPDHRDVLRCEVVPQGGVDRGELAGVVRERIRSRLRFDAEVILVEDLEPEPAVIDLRTWD
jgi:phenylacetate-CoA ligase